MGYEEVHRLVDGAALWQVALVAGLGFGAIYFGFAALSMLATRRLLPHLGIGSAIDPRPLPAGQVHNEILRSLGSITIFAAYGACTIHAERADWIAIVWTPTAGRIVFDLLILSLWNELHFYLCHRLLHTRWLYRRVHVVHHRSVVPTPFSTYSFHPVEATMLSSVMILLLLLWPLDIVTIVVFPLLSLVGNSIGHMNYAVFPAKDPGELLAACQRHTAHHSRVTGNYGFYLPWLDRCFGSHSDRRGEDRS